MALSKQSVIDQVTILENGVVQVRRSDRIIEDGAVHSQSYHRTTIDVATPLNQPEVTRFFANCDAADKSRVLGIIRRSRGTD